MTFIYTDKKNVDELFYNPVSFAEFSKYTPSILRDGTVPPAQVPEVVALLTKIVFLWRNGEIGFDTEKLKQVNNKMMFEELKRIEKEKSGYLKEHDSEFKKYLAETYKNKSKSNTANVEITKE